MDVGGTRRYLVDRVAVICNQAVPHKQGKQPLLPRKPWRRSPRGVHAWDLTLQRKCPIHHLGCDIMAPPTRKQRLARTIWILHTPFNESQRTHFATNSHTDFFTWQIGNEWNHLCTRFNICPRITGSLGRVCSGLQPWQVQSQLANVSLLSYQHYTVRFGKRCLLFPNVI